MLRNLQLKFLKRFYCKQEEKINRENNFWKDLKHIPKIPKETVTHNFKNQNNEIKIDLDTIRLLERLSLINLEHKEALKTLEDSIKFANLISYINTDNIEPLYTVLEKEQLDLRDDIISDGNIRDDILKNAKVTEEDYFVAPPGNIPLEQEDKVLQ